jgi:hypothetical protein
MGLFRNYDHLDMCFDLPSLCIQLLAENAAKGPLLSSSYDTSNLSYTLKLLCPRFPSGLSARIKLHSIQTEDSHHNWAGFQVHHVCSPRDAHLQCVCVFRS